MKPERRKRYRGYNIEEVVNLVLEPSSDSETSEIEEEEEEEGDNFAPNEPNIEAFYSVALSEGNVDNNDDNIEEIR